MILKIKKIDDNAVIPVYKHKGDAGMDICSVENILIPPGERTLVRTGLVFELSEGLEAQIRPRSGLALNHGITVLNSPGTIDSGYRGEVGVILINHGEEPFMVEVGMRIAQVVIAKYTSAEIEEVSDVNNTERAEGGFGSTGVK